MIRRVKYDYGYGYKKGRMDHRANGPAVIYYDGQFLWYLNDQCHRYYGPATSTNEWWLNNDYIKVDDS